MDTHSDGNNPNEKLSIDFANLLLASSDRLDLNKQDINGNTPLHYAVAAQNASGVAWLLDHGADPEIRNKRGYTALALAVDPGQWGWVLSLNKSAKNKDQWRPLLQNR